jgi:hypothetical protein
MLSSCTWRSSGSFSRHWIRGRLASEIWRHGRTSSSSREAGTCRVRRHSDCSFSSTARQGFLTSRPRCGTPFTGTSGNAPALRGGGCDDSFISGASGSRSVSGSSPSPSLPTRRSSDLRTMSPSSSAKSSSSAVGWRCGARSRSLCTTGGRSAPTLACSIVWPRCRFASATDHADLPMLGGGIGRPPRPFLLATPKDEPPHRSRVRSSGSRPARGLHRGSRSSAIARRPNGLYGSRRHERYTARKSHYPACGGKARGIRHLHPAGFPGRLRGARAAGAGRGAHTRRAVLHLA